MCENELWCPECGLREGNWDIEERDNRSIIARLKYMLGLKSCSFRQPKYSFHFIYQKRFMYREISHNSSLYCVRARGVLVGSFLLHFSLLTQTA